METNIPRETQATIRESMLLSLSEYHAATKELIDTVLAASLQSKGNNPLPATPQKAMEKLLEKDAKLHELLEELEQHQRFQLRIANIKKEIEEKDRSIQQIAFQLKKAEGLLEEVVEDAKSKLAVIETSDEGSVLPEELIAYAHKISYTSAPPVGWVQGMPLGMFRPPQPQEDEMRSGILVQNTNVKV
eukprot:TRINITY_DN4035_c0_g1_i1.p1 TRINITY_DN4035_c0_g1~~TRINITY_DN4035_c0_g1_i1.p1  ORF type:complete len:188 (-),score=53.72 TRINITY_DN4035_c0_g1_i1:129-692(-)